MECTAICPINKKVDKYRIFLKSEKIIEVEKIKDLLQKMERKEIFQEDLTRVVSEKLGATVSIEGMHSGVFVRSTCP